MPLPSLTAQVERNRRTLAGGLGLLLERVNPFLPGRPHDRLVETATREPAARVLDLCTGTGFTARLLAEAMPDAQVHGIDISAEMIAHGKRLYPEMSTARIALTVGDVSALPFADGSIDLVTATFGFHELRAATRTAALDEAARVLRPGGRLVAMDLDRPRRAGMLMDAYFTVAEPAHARDVLGEGLADALRRAGFSIATHERALYFQILVARR